MAGARPGLTAAEALSRAGMSVAILEARERVGGRIHTIQGLGGLPIELGAEFVHGARHATWPLLRAAKLKAMQVPDRHFQATKGGLIEGSEFWNELDAVFSQASKLKADTDFQTFLHKHRDLSPSARRLAKQFVEGFHAAPVERMSVLALARAEAASADDEGERQFRLARGYGALLDWWVQQLEKRGVKIHFSTAVRRVRWRPGKVEVEACTLETKLFSSSKAVVTLPLGVLQAKGPEAVAFDPPLPAEKARAITGLGFGAVTKLILLFRERFWPVENFGFIHSEDAVFPTWWSDSRGLSLTGWAGGPKAQRAAQYNVEELVAEAVRALARIFRVEPRRIRDDLAASYTHNWTQDPFSLGAYSYTPVRMLGMPRVLAAPVKSTLFFAGEATDNAGEQGTVQAAIASGQRAAREVVAMVRRAGARKPRFRIKGCAYSALR